MTRDKLIEIQTILEQVLTQAPNDELIYVAAPYESNDPLTKLDRMQTVSRYLIHLMNNNSVGLCSLPFGHLATQLLAKRDLPNSFLPHSFALLGVSAEMHIITLSGWRWSSGVQAELDLARAKGITVYTVEPVDIGFAIPVLFTGDTL